MTSNLQPYPAYKLSGVEWLGAMPAHWEVRRLRTLAANIVDQTTQRHEHEIALALEHVESWSGRYVDAGPGMTFESQLKRFQTGDVLFGKLRPYLAKVACPDKPGVCVGEFLVLRLRDGNMSPGYLQQILHTKPIIDAINASTFGAKMPRAEWQFIGNMEQPVPPLAEQTAIVRFLDHTDRRIRRYIRAKQKLVALLEEQKQAIIHQAVTGQIDVRTGQPYPAYKYSGVEWLGDVPAHWEVRRLKHAAALNPSRTEASNSLVSDTTVTFLPMERVWPDGRIDPQETLPASKVWNGFTYFRRDDVLVAKITPCFENGKGAHLHSLPTAIGFGSTEFHVLRAKSFILPQFLYRLTTASEFRRRGTDAMTGAAGQQRVPPSFIANYPISLPPLPEQTAIVAYLDKTIAGIDTAIARARRQIDLMQEYAARLIADVVTGKLDVCEAAAALPEAGPLATKTAWMRHSPLVTSRNSTARKSWQRPRADHAATCGTEDLPHCARGSAVLDHCRRQPLV